MRSKADIVAANQRSKPPRMVVTGEKLGPPVEESFLGEVDARCPIIAPEPVSTRTADDRPADRRAEPDVAAKKRDLHDRIEGLRMGGGMASLVETFFEIPDTKVEYAELRRFLKSDTKGSSLGYGELADLLNEAREMAMRGVELACTARVQLEEFEGYAKISESAMREEAQDELNGLYADGKIPKPTLDAVASRIVQLYPDEVKDLTLRRKKNKESVVMFEALERQLDERAKDVRQMVARVRRVDD